MDKKQIEKKAEEMALKAFKNLKPSKVSGTKKKEK